MRCPYCIKICSKCGKLLIANTMNFRKKKDGKYGLRAECKICKKQLDKKYREDNIEKIKEKNKQYYEKNKNNILKKNKEYYEENKNNILKKQKQYYENKKETSEYKEYCKRYRKKHKENRIEYDKKYREEHKEEISKNKKQWKINNPDKVFNNHNKRRILEENQGRGIAKEQWLKMMEFFDWKCAYSGEKLNKDTRTIDHIISLSEGGLNEPWNCVPMIKKYNSSKHTNKMEDWYVEQDFFDINRLLRIYDWIEYAYNKWGDFYED